ncbi:hypothetical protein QF023_000209 [Chryseobacterium sp. SLBN-27]|nr:hypothetical protein [Chryseobacterium sp. SLBN-27]
MVELYNFKKNNYNIHINLLRDKVIVFQEKYPNSTYSKIKFRFKLSNLYL